MPFNKLFDGQIIFRIKNSIKKVKHILFTFLNLPSRILQEQIIYYHLPTQNLVASGSSV